MKKLSEKFDRLPQDFDREAIWKGIEKPKRLFIYRPEFWTAFAAALSGVLLFVFIPDNTPQPSAVSAFDETPFAQEKSFVFPEKEESITSFKDSLLMNPISAQKTKSKTEKAEKEYPITSSIQSSGKIGQAERKAVKEPIAQSPPASPSSLESRPEKEKWSPTKRLPKLALPVKSTERKQLFSQSKKIITKQKSIKQSVSVRGGIGLHRSRFFSPNEETSTWRTQLEQPQLDYSLGLKYELLVWQDFLISVSATYHLYKDKINADHVLKSAVQDSLISYRLHNHYHLFAGQIEVGRRFYQKNVFWDVRGGLGITYRQFVETDFFIQEGNLADRAQIEGDYRQRTDTFITGEAAVGKHLNSRLIIRMGVQFQSGRNLTHAQAGIQHRILSVNGFLEAGIRF